MVIYMCNRCEVMYGEPQPDCDNRYCGKDFEDVEDKV